MFKKLEINIPFGEALAQIPHYTKFMKDIINKNRKLDEGGVVNLSTICTAIIQKNLPQKMKDLGSFTIPCTIGNHEFGKALCDFGASINLMPLLVVRRLYLGELTPITMSLHMADKSMAQPEGTLEDVLIKVGKFIFPVDFMVIDIEEDKKIPIFIYKPFLATGPTPIDVKKGELTLRVGIEEVHLNLNQSLKQHDVEKAQCMRVDNVIHVSKDQNGDPFNESILNSLYNENLEKEELKAKVELIEAVLSLNEESNAESSSSSKVKEQDVYKIFEGLILKEFPKNLKYVFLGVERSKPMIIVADLSTEKEQKVVEILKEHKEAIA